LNIAGTMNWIDGTASVNLVVANNGILNLTGTAPKTINSGKALTNNGTIAWVNGNIVLAGLGTIIDNYSIISQTGTNNLVQAGGGITEFRNQLTGIFTKTTGTGATFFSTATINTGTINLNSNTLSLGNNFNNIGVINIAAGGTLQNDAAFTWGGSINFENATFSNGKTLVINTLQTVDAFETLKMSASINSDATIIGTGTLLIAGTMNWIDGTASVNLEVVNNGILNLTGTANKTINSGKSLTNNGTIAWSNGNIVLAGVGAVIDNYNTFTQTGNNNIIQSGSGYTEFRNAGTGTFTKNSPPGTSTYSLAVKNLGIFNCDGGTLVFSNIGSNLGGGLITVRNGGSLLCNASFTCSGLNAIVLENGSLTSSSEFIISNGTTLKGSGNYMFNSIPFTNTGGIFSPGNTSPGLLNINGVQPLNGNTKINIDIFNGNGAGSGHDQVQRTGNLTLAGTLTVTETGNVPSGTYTIIQLNTGIITGIFTSVNLPSNYTLTVNATNVTVTKSCSINAPIITSSGPTTFCAGSNITLTSSAASGTHLWSTGATTQSITVSSSGNYTVINSDENGCVSAASAPAVVIVNPIPSAPTIGAIGASPLCGDESITLVSSETSGNSWTLLNSSNVLANTQNYIVSAANTAVNATSTFVVTTTTNGCTSAASAPFNVTIFPLPATPIITPNGPTTFCDGGSVTLTSNAATDNVWSNGQTGTNITVLNSGSYSVTVTNSINGCSSAASLPVIVTVNPNTTYFRDADGDGFGNGAISVLACSVPTGFVTNADDCNDNNPNIYPGATEILNNQDDDCDGSIDEGLTCPEGGLIWQKTLGGSGVDIATSVQQTADGGYIVAGTSGSNNGNVTGNHGHYDYWIVKLNNAGIIQWQKSLGGSGDDYATSIQQTADGGYIVAGYSKSNNGDVTGNHSSPDYWIVKLNNAGIIQWQKSLGGSGTDMATSIQQTADGGYIVAGYSNSNDGDVTGNHGDHDYWIVKLNNAGIIQWQKSLGGSGYDCANSVQQTADGGYIVAGFSISNNGDVTGNHGIDYWIVKLNNTGIIQWQRTLGGGGDDQANSVQQTADGGYIVAGLSRSNNGDVTGNHGGADYWIVKLNNAGNIQWQKSLGGSGYDYATSIQQTADGGYIVAGNSNSNNGDVTGNHGGTDYWIVKLNNAGIIQWQKSLGGSVHDYARSVQQTADGGYIVACTSGSNNGDVTGNHGSTDYWIVKLSGTNPTTFYADADGDGYGNPIVSMMACEKPAGYVADNTDCDDSKNYVYPGAIELCGNGIDDNCNGLIDEINNLPSITAIYGPVNVCSYLGGGSVGYGIESVSNAINYIWTVPENVTIASGQGTSSIFVNFSSSFANNANKQIKVFAVSACDTSNTMILYLAAQLPSIPDQITASSASICPFIGTNNPVTYKIGKTPGASSYNWTAQPGNTIITHLSALPENDTIVEVRFTSGFSSSNISVQAINSCGVSSIRSLYIDRANPSTPGLISGPTNACEYISPNGQTAQYSVSGIPGNVYTWTIPPGALNFTGQGTNIISFKYPLGFTTGTISVFVTNGCGTSGARSLSIQTLNPAAPGVIDVIQLQTCPNRIYSYTVANMPSNASSLEWTIPADATLLSGQGTTSIRVSYPLTAINSKINVRAISNCRSSAVRSTGVKLPACFIGGRVSNLNREQVNPFVDKTLKMELDIYPNPTTTNFKIQVKTPGKDLIVTRIFDMQGRIINSMTVQPNQIEQLGASLKPGSYMIEVTQGQERIIKKLVKL